ncbi:PAS domain S-box protein [Chlorogloeopsis sp. ULAP02]|uniref:PAS domain S-box protein n=1 Tax=Chlorogloeopsis sp. ULAP02 TaxID=3107926 RepID=UPI00313730DA
MMSLRFLLLEDNPLDADMVEATLMDGGIESELLRVETQADFVRALETDEFDLILADYSLPGFDGISALEIACTLRPEVPFIFVSGSLGEELAIEALKQGATDYVFKQRLERLVPCVQRALREAKGHRELKRAALLLVEQNRVLELIASGHPLDECLRAVCASVSKLNPRARACFLLTDAQRRTFNNSITPDFAPSFGQGLKDAPINDLCIGTCGEAVYRGQPISCADIANDDRWSQEWRDLCVAHGILACHSKPMLGIDGLPLGSLMLCFDQARLPTEWEHQLSEFGTKVASIAFERDRSNLVLRDSEAKYRTLFESIDEGFCICEMLFDENGEPQDYRFLEVNSVFATLTGLEQATGKTARELVPNLEAFWVETYGRVVQTGEAVRFEQQSVVMNRWFDVYAFCIGAAQNHQFGILFTNISERKQAEQEREQFLAVGSDLQVITGNNGYFQWVSPTFKQTLGWTTEEMTSRPWTEFVHPGDINPSLSEAANLFSGHETIAFENRYRHKDGSYRWLLWKAQPCPEKQVIYGVAVDITDRKQAEQALRESEEQLRLASEGANLGMWYWDAEKDTLTWTDQAKSMFGLPADTEMSMQVFLEAVHPDDRPFVQTIVSELQVGQPHTEIEYRTQWADGTIRWILARGDFAYNGDGMLMATRGVLMDITDRKQIEAEIQQLNQQLTHRLNELQTLFDLLPIGVAIAEDPECRVIRANLHLSELIRLPVNTNASHSALADEHPLYRLCRDGEEIPLEALPMQYAAIHNTAVRDEVVDLVHPDGTLVKLLCYASPLLDEQGRVRGALGAFVDITQRVLDEDNLRQSEERFRTIVQTANEGVWLISTEAQTLYVNDRMAEILGCTSKEIFDRPVLEFCFPEDIASAQERIGCNLQGKSEQFDFRFRRQDGSEVLVLAGTSPIRDGQGNIMGALGMFTDVTNRRRAEAALRESMAILNTVNQATPTLIYVKDRQGRLLLANPATLRAIGKTEAEIIGKTEMDFLSREEAQQIVENDRRVMQTGQVQVFEETVALPDGTRTFLSTKSPYRDEQGNMIGLIGVSTDITDRRRADERLHLLYETTRDLLATEQPMQLMNNLFSKLSSQLELHSYYNYMVEAKDNRSLLHLRNYGGISDEAAESIAWIEFGQYLCGVVAQERRPFILDQVQIITHPNAQLVCSMGITAYAGYPLMAQGRLLGTLSFASLTRTHFTPEEIDLLQSTCEQVAIALERANLIASIQQQAEQLQQANRIKDEFLAVLSHELRSPLNPILGWSKLLQSGKLDKARAKQALATIERNAKLQAELIEDLLDVSRILRGKLSLNVSSVDLVPTIQAAMETVRLAAEAKSIQIQARFEPNVGEVSGDPNRLQQVIWNLLSNAIKFTPQGGRVEVKLSLVTSHTLREAEESASTSFVEDGQPKTNNQGQMTNDKFAQITVTDTGKGIHPDFLPYVFDYFRQEDGATTRKFGGLGLGLAIVRHLVELHGGTVDVESPGEGQGATFTVKLPLMPNLPQTNSHSQASEPFLNLQGIKVLVVDDAADTREFIAFLLETYGANVTAVASAVEALAALAQDRADVLVSDIGMPDMDGYMLMRQLRALPTEQGGQIPAIALTAYAGEIDYQQAMLAGFQKHMPKPVDPANLVEAIISLVGVMAEVVS